MPCRAIQQYSLRRLDYDSQNAPNYLMAYVLSGQCRQRKERETGREKVNARLNASELKQESECAGIVFMQCNESNIFRVISCYVTLTLPKKREDAFSFPRQVLSFHSLEKTSKFAPPRK